MKRSTDARIQSRAGDWSDCSHFGLKSQAVTTEGCARSSKSPQRTSIKRIEINNKKKVQPMHKGFRKKRTATGLCKCIYVYTNVYCTYPNVYIYTYI